MGAAQRMYQSKIGEIRTYEGWRSEAQKFYAGLTDDGISYIQPKDWFKRFTKVLKLTLVVNEGPIEKHKEIPLTCRKCEMLETTKYLRAMEDYKL